MHIPPFHKLRTWQYILVGTVAGGIIAYCILIFMYGSMYEQLLEKKLNIQSQYDELESQHEALIKDKEKLDEQSKEPMTVDSIEIVIINQKELKLDRLITHQLEDMIKQEINHIIGKDVNIVSESMQLLLSSIENKAFSIDDFTYYLEIKKLTISNKVKLAIETKIHK